jgi:hypothetical protein
MGCNYLCKLQTDEKWEHFLLGSECQSSSPRGAALKYFAKRYKDHKIRLGNFEQKVAEVGACPVVEVQYVQGIAACHDTYEIQVGEVKSLRDVNLPPTPDNIVPGQALVAKLTVSKLQVLPYFAQYLETSEA